ncbi:MAG TPA: molybdopterin-binding protein [Candidatus Nanopelagicaceae bacterium]
MDSQISVKNMLAELLAISYPLAPFDMPLLDAHGATLAANIYAGEQLVLQQGVRIRSPQIGLAASIGLARLPTQPHPRVVIISAGDDLVEPGQEITRESEEFETNSWMLATAAKEAGAVAYRVLAIPENHDQLKVVIEDQLVRADLIVISGESDDGSFELIEEVLGELGDVVSVTPNLEGSSKHCYGTIGEDGIPVIALPGESISAYISFEIFIRPMIRTMLGVRNVFRGTVRATITSDIESPIGITSLVRASLVGLTTDSPQVTVLKDQDQLYTLSDASALVAIAADSPGFLKGEAVEIIILDRTT